MSDRLATKWCTVINPDNQVVTKRNIGLVVLLLVKQTVVASIKMFCCYVKLRI
jgi:hypothetical protein